MAEFKSKGMKIEIFDEITSAAYYGNYIELYTENSVITLDVDSKDEAIKIFEEHNLIWG